MLCCGWSRKKLLLSLQKTYKFRNNNGRCWTSSTYYLAQVLARTTRLHWCARGGKGGGGCGSCASPKRSCNWEREEGGTCKSMRASRFVRARKMAHSTHAIHFNWASGEAALLERQMATCAAILSLSSFPSPVFLKSLTELCTKTARCSPFANKPTGA